MQIMLSPSWIRKETEFADSIRSAYLINIKKLTIKINNWFFFIENSENQIHSLNCSAVFDNAVDNFLIWFIIDHARIYIKHQIIRFHEILQSISIHFRKISIKNDQKIFKKMLLFDLTHPIILNMEQANWT